MNDTGNWQKGFALDTLKEFGGLFKLRHKDLVFGAFGLTKERDVAEYLSKQRAIWTGKPPEACALFTITEMPSTQTDFAQREFGIPPGSVVVKAFACKSVAAGRKVMKALAERAKDRPLWVEIFEEDRIAYEVLSAEGLGYVTTKISAGSEIKGVYTRELSPLPPLEPAELATLLVVAEHWLLASGLAEVREELRTYGDHFAQHYSDYNKRKSWTSFALRGYQDDERFIIKPSEMSKSWKEENAALLAERPRWTKAAAHFPKTIAHVERLGLELDRVRFMQLRSKDGELSRHADITDREAGVADGMIARLHVPIYTSEAVEFMGWTERGQRMTYNWPAGALCYLDQRKPHAVKNSDPNLNRVHLVIDCKADARLRRQIAEAHSASALTEAA